MPHFAPFLAVGLQNYEDTTVCVVATGIVGDLCRALDTKIAPYCDSILQVLYTNLQNKDVDKKIKAAIMVNFGDPALAVKGDFEKYLAPVVNVLGEAASTRVEHGPADSEEWQEYIENLREGVLEAYSGIVHGLQDGGKVHIFKEHVNAVLDFVRRIVEEPRSSDTLMKSALGVVGDLVIVFQQELVRYIRDSPMLQKLVEYGDRSGDQDVKSKVVWLRGLIMRNQT